MFRNKLLYFTIQLLTLFALILNTACVNETGEKFADCLEGEAFNSRTRKCDSTFKSPVPILKEITILEDSGTSTFTLDYVDPNGDSAVACKVTENSFNIEVQSPLIDSVPQEALNIAAEALAMANGIPNSFVTEKANALIAANDALAAATAANGDVSNAASVSALKIVIERVELTVELAKNVTDSPTRIASAKLLARSIELAANTEHVENRCYCSASICRIYVTPNENYYGVDNFTFTLTDANKLTSVVQQVGVNVLSVNDRPVGVSQDVSFDEAVGTDAVTVGFMLNLARDIEDDFNSFLFSYEVVTLPTKGTISDCMDLTGSDGPADRTCNYLPATGDEFGQGIIASTTISNLIFQAKATGEFGNHITIRYLAHTKLNIAGNEHVAVIFSNNGADAKIEIYIEDGVSTSLNVKNAIENNILATALVDITGTPDGTIQNITGDNLLTGGVNGVDFITYKVNDGVNDSEYITTISINILEQDDPPKCDASDLGTIHINEDEVSSIVLLYTNTDNEPEVGETCTLYNLVNMRAFSCACDTSGVCIAQVISDPKNFSGNASFEYSIFDGSSYLVATEGKCGVATVVVDPVNDKPVPIHQTVTQAESATSLSHPINFVVEMPYDDDDPNGTVNDFGFKIIDQPANGVLSNCDLISLNLNCTYTPNNGNSTGQGTPAEVLIRGLHFQMKANGEMGNNFSVEYIEGEVFGGIDIQLSGTTFIIEIDSIATNPITVITPQLIKDAIDAHIGYSRLLDVTVINNAIDQVVVAAQPFLNGTYGLDHFSYEVTDLYDVADYKGVVSIDLTPVNDVPIICAYSQFNQANECGLKGCIDSNDPNTLQIIPARLDLRFYDSANAVCYKSISITTGPFWEPVDTFDQLVANIIVNEKDLIIISPIKVDEGGGDPSEDTQRLILNKIISSDQIILPDANIVMEYDGSPVIILDPLGPFGSATASEDLLDMTLKIRPAGGKFGDVDVTIQLEDTDGALIDITIHITINPVSAQHGDWVNLKSIGPALDKDDVLYNQDYTCSYSRDKCNGGKFCTGVLSPKGIITPDLKNSIYYDSANKKCYYSTGTTLSEWTEFKTSCNISPVEYESSGCSAGSCICSGASCIITDDPRLDVAFIPTSLDNSVYDRVNDKCYRSIGTASSADWQEYKAPGTVILQWGDFSVTGVGAIVGYNVYRRLANSEFDYNNPINKVKVDAFDKYFSDDFENSWYPPHPRTVYYYQVRPLIQSNGEDPIATSTEETFSVARLLVPDANLVFAHRWIVNKKMCQLIQSATDPTENYRCAYEGPGDTGLASSQAALNNFYDIGNDLIVDRVEAGCPYTKSPACDTIEGTCMGISDPDGGVDAENGAIYYGRSSGKCFINVSIFAGTSWREMSAARVADCPYALNDCEPTASGHCIGHLIPDVNITAVTAGAKYFQETTGKCFVNVAGGGSVWTEINPDDPAPAVPINPIHANYDFTRLKLPPLVNVTQASANLMCSHRSLKPIVGIDCEAKALLSAGVSNVAPDDTNPLNPAVGDFYFDTSTDECYVKTDSHWVKSNFKSQLPGRKEQLAYSQWDVENNTDSQIQTLEAGLSLISSAKCNSSSASGVSDQFSDANIPDSSTFFSVPGTQASSIRSVMTGSTLTSDCQSRFGVQDVVGNVSEWTRDRMICDQSNQSCEAMLKDEASLFLLNTATNDMRAGDGNDFGDGAFGGYDKVRFDGYLGPCIDIEPDGICDSPMESWSIDEEEYDANRFIIPMGFPAHVNFPFNNQKSVVGPYLEEIGPTSGITPVQLHGDVIDFNMSEVYGGNVDGCAAMVGGGSYLTGEGSGMYYFKLLPCQEQRYLKADGVKYLAKTFNSGVTLELSAPVIASSAFSITVTGTDILVSLETDASGDVVTFGAQIILELNADVAASALISASKSGDDTIPLSSFPAILVEFNDAENETKKSDDIGFRCVAPVSGYLE